MHDRIAAGAVYVLGIIASLGVMVFLMVKYNSDGKPRDKVGADDGEDR